jgi:hypothetical protein
MGLVMGTRKTDLTLYMGQDYTVATLPGESHNAATVNFGRCQDKAERRKAKAFVRRFNSQPALLDAGRLAIDQLETFALSVKGDADLTEAIRGLKRAIRGART